MPTLVATQTATVTILAPGGYITVTCAAGDVMLVTWISPGSISGSRTVSQVTEDVGPFSDGTTVTLRAMNGSPQYSDSSLTPAQVAMVQSLIGGERVFDTGSRTITALDNGAALAPTVALTYTIPAGLSPMPSFTVDCPSAGSVSIARSGAATLNGAGTTLTRARAGNPVGFVVLAHSETDSYGVSGA